MYYLIWLSASIILFPHWTKRREYCFWSVIFFSLETSWLRGGFTLTSSVWIFQAIIQIFHFMCDKSILMGIYFICYAQSHQMQSCMLSFFWFICISPSNQCKRQCGPTQASLCRQIKSCLIKLDFFFNVRMRIISASLFQNLTPSIILFSWESSSFSSS